MIYYHPDPNILTEYASGSLPWALSISVAAHLQMCPQCRHQAAGLNTLGAAILTTSVSEPVEPCAYNQVLARIKAEAETSTASAPQTSAAPQTTVAPQASMAYAQEPLLNGLPKVIAKLLPTTSALKWRRMSSVLSSARLVTGQDQYEVAFQRIRRGGRVVEHGHAGLEVTLVLQGSFSDAEGVYNPGDFLVRNAGEVHRPMAAANADCLCFSVCAAPVQLSGFMGKLISPFLRFRPA